MKPFVTAIIGIVLGFSASKMLFLQWITLVPWGIAGFLIGYFSKSKNYSTINGFVYGFFLGFVFMIGQYNGKDPLITKIPAFIFLGIVSAIFGMISSLVGYLIKLRIRKNS